VSGSLSVPGIVVLRHPPGVNAGGAQPPNVGEVAATNPIYTVKPDGGNDLRAVAPGWLVETPSWQPVP